MRRVWPAWVWRATAVAGVAVLLWAMATVGLVWSTMPLDVRASLSIALSTRWPLVVMALVLGALGLAALMAWAHKQWIASSGRLAERVEQAVAQTDLREMAAPDLPQLARMVQALNALLRQRGQMQDDIEQRVAQVSERVQAERNQLAALMAELNQSVVVCNREGQVLLFNQRARLQFRALAADKGEAAAAWLGIGRSIYSVLDAGLVAHALREVEVRLERGASNPSATFVTATPSGHLLRVHVGSVATPQASGVALLGGFVLLIDNITRDFQEQAERDDLLHGLTERGRASLANMKTAVQTLERSDLDQSTRVRVRQIIHEEVAAMQTRIEHAAQHASAEFVRRWPLQDMLASDFASVAARQLETLVPVTWVIEEVTEGLWLRLDSYSLVQALAHLASRLVDAFGLRHLRLRITTVDERAQMDLVWAGAVLSTETAMSWELDPMQSGGQISAMSVRDVIDRHGAQMWFERERVRHEAFFRWILPMRRIAPQTPEELPPGQERPEFFDFDLFATTAQSRAMDERGLTELAYTVFDTETTGMNPSGGDEIIQLGAVRIVNGRLMPGESIDQLVDPQRDIPAITIPVHGITPDMVAGKPKILEVLPSFHAFAQDTVIVAHNAAFDMRLLELKQAALGLVFDHPVLDTLLLSAVVHPEQESHRLDAIADRFGVTVTGRHTAMGDALVTAQVFLKLIPLLHAKGITTLGQARHASQQTYYARLKY
jgi:DNA polymerase III subunit epsilon